MGARSLLVNTGYHHRVISKKLQNYLTICISFLFCLISTRELVISLYIKSFDCSFVHIHSSTSYIILLITKSNICQKVICLKVTQYEVNYYLRWLRVRLKQAPSKVTLFCNICSFIKLSIQNNFYLFVLLTKYTTIFV